MHVCHLRACELASTDTQGALGRTLQHNGENHKGVSNYHHVSEHADLRSKQFVIKRSTEQASRTQFQKYNHNKNVSMYMHVYTYIYQYILQEVHI
jgi:hypothetical protein